MIKSLEKVNAILKETEALIAITAASIETAKKNLNLTANKIEH